jgi:hypothetical protein
MKLRFVSHGIMEAAIASIPFKSKIYLSLVSGTSFFTSGFSFEARQQLTEYYLKIKYLV